MAKRKAPAKVDNDVAVETSNTVRLKHQVKLHGQFYVAGTILAIEDEDLRNELLDGDAAELHAGSDAHPEVVEIPTAGDGEGDGLGDE